MPYIITTTEPIASSYSEFGDHYCRTTEGELCGPYASEQEMRADFIVRRAVATLDEVPTRASRALHLGEPNHPNHRGAHRVLASLAALPEQGGTVGPLPDGTVIEVEYRTSNEMRDAVGYVTAGQIASPSELAQILDAYNAAQN